MKLSTYIAQLKTLLEEHGDLEVQASQYGERQSAPAPVLAYERLLQGTEHKPRFFSQYDHDERRGALVIKV